VQRGFKYEERAFLSFCLNFSKKKIAGFKITIQVILFRQQELRATIALAERIAKNKGYLQF